MSHGVIHNAGGDKFAHLGHFRSPDVLKKGHNQGVPPLSGVMPAPYEQPRRQVVLGGQAIERAGAGKARRAIRTGGQGALNVAAERPVLAAKMAAKQANLGAPQRREMVAAARLDPNARGMERQATRQNLATAVGDVRSSRQALRGAIRGGDALGAAAGRANLTAAKSARRESKREVRNVRKGRY